MPFSNKRERALGGKDDSSSGVEIYKMNLGDLRTPERKEVLKRKIAKMGVCQRWRSAQMSAGRDPNGQS